MPAERRRAASPVPRPVPTALSIRAAAVRFGLSHWTATLATACPDHDAPAGQPCTPPVDPGQPRGRGAPRPLGMVCATRSVAAARATGRMAELAASVGRGTLGTRP